MKMDNRSIFCIITALFPPEPVVSGKLSEDIATELGERYQVVVICPKPSRPLGFTFEQQSKKSKNKIIRLNSYVYPKSGFLGRLIESFSFGKESTKYINNNSNIIRVIYVNTWPLLAQYLTIRSAKNNKIPVIIHIQDIYPESIYKKLPFFKPIFKLIFLPVDKYVLRNATKIITISEKMKQYIIKTRNISYEKIEVIKNWQDESVFMKYRNTNKTGQKQNKQFTFMYLGNIGPVAGLEIVIKAFAEAKLRQSRLVIAGSGSAKNTLKKIAAKFSELSILFWSVPEGNVPEIQDRADVMLLPVKKGAALSSIPSKLPAYMFSSKPIIGSVDKESDTSRAISESGCGWVVEPEAVEQLCDAMKKAVETEKMDLEEMGEKGFRYAIQHFSRQHNLPRLAEIIEKTV